MQTRHLRDWELSFEWRRCRINNLHTCYIFKVGPALDRLKKEDAVPGLRRWRLLPSGSLTARDDRVAFPSCSPNGRRREDYYPLNTNAGVA
jgi:hypothetical protein